MFPLLLTVLNRDCNRGVRESQGGNLIRDLRGCLGRYIGTLEGICLTSDLLGGPFDLVSGVRKVVMGIIRGFRGDEVDQRSFQAGFFWGLP